MNVKNVTAYVVLALYVVILFTLLRPGGTGQTGVANWGLGLTGLLTA
jgi:hypothetical protein